MWRQYMRTKVARHRHRRGRRKCRQSRKKKTKTSRCLHNQSAGNLLDKKQQDLLNTKLSAVDTRQSKILFQQCLDADRCVDLGAYHGMIDAYFDQFRNLQLIQNRHVRKIGGVSNNGFVFRVPFEKKEFVANTVLKCVLKPESDNLAYEYWVGKHFVNPLLDIYPCFVETYDLYNLAAIQLSPRQISAFKQLIPFMKMLTPQQIERQFTMAVFMYLSHTSIYQMDEDGRPSSHPPQLDPRIVKMYVSIPLSLEQLKEIVRTNPAMEQLRLHEIVQRYSISVYSQLMNVLLYVERGTLVEEMAANGWINLSPAQIRLFRQNNPEMQNMSTQLIKQHYSHDSYSQLAYLLFPDLLQQQQQQQQQKVQLEAGDRGGGLTLSQLMQRMDAPLGAPFDPSFCKNSLHLALLIQHFGVFYTLDDILDATKWNGGYELPTLMYQLYFVLAQLGDRYTHYDLHPQNVCVYMPYPAEEDDQGNVLFYHIEMHYHTASGAVISFPSRFIVKIIDYGRNYVKMAGGGGVSTAEYIDAVCNTAACAPDCGYDYGFSIVAGNVSPNPSTTATEYFITPTVPNVSHDLLPLNFYKKQLQAFYPNVQIDYIGKANPHFGTQEKRTNTFDPASAKPMVSNVFDANAMLEYLLLLQTNEKGKQKQNVVSQIRSIYTNNNSKKMADLHVYADGRPYTFTEVGSLAVKSVPPLPPYVPPHLRPPPPTTTTATTTTTSDSPFSLRVSSSSASSPSPASLPLNASNPVGAATSSSSSSSSDGSVADLTRNLRDQHFDFSPISETSETLPPPPLRQKIRLKQGFHRPVPAYARHSQTQPEFVTDASSAAAAPTKPKKPSILSRVFSNFTRRRNPKTGNNPMRVIPDVTG